MSSSNLLSVSDVNKLTYEEFVEKFGNVVEHCALFAASVCQERPFSAFKDINNAFSKFMDDLPMSAKEGILRLHPDLAGRLAMTGQLTSESSKEQSAAALDMMTGEERKKMSRLNTQYKEKFGFPFVICARLNKKEAILNGLESRLKNSKQEEAIAGTNEVKKIACLRLKDIVCDDSTS